MIELLENVSHLWPCKRESVRQCASLRRALLISGCMLLALSASLLAQSSMDSLFSPPAFRPTGKAGLRFSMLPATDIDSVDQSLSLSVLDGDLRYALPVGSGREVSFSADLAAYRLSTDALLADYPHPLPERLWDVGAGVGYRQWHNSSRSWGVSTGVSSPSDTPFHSLSETIVQITAIYRTGWRRRHNLTLMLNYSNQRSFLNHWPLPGIAYDYQPNRNVLILVGVPFMMSRIRFADVWNASIFYFPPIRGHVELSRRLPAHLEAFVGVQSRRDAFLLAGRSDDDSWLRHDLYLGEIGLRWAKRPLTIDMALGYAFGRELYYSDSFSEAGSGSLDMDNSFSGHVNLSRRF